MKCLLALPHAIATTHQVFSRVKIDTRNHSKTTVTVSAISSVKEGKITNGDHYSFNLSDELVITMQSAAFHECLLYSFRQSEIIQLILDGLKARPA